MENGLQKLQELAQKAREEGKVDQKMVDLFPRKPEQKESAAVSIEEAEKMFGKDFLGPQEAARAFGVTIYNENVLPIPFSRQELENAKALGQQLIFQAAGMLVQESAISPVYDHITPKNIKARFPMASDGKPMWYNQDWYDTEEFFTEKIPQPYWKLTSKDVIPDSISKNYLEQTEVLVSHIKNEVFKGIELPKEYVEAIEEFEQRKAMINLFLEKGDNEIAGNHLAELKITSLTRETPVEAMYRFVLQDRTNKEKSLSSKYTWTSRRDSGGGFVYVGPFDSDGALVRSRQPDDSLSHIGVSCSRMK